MAIQFDSKKQKNMTGWRIDLILCVIMAHCIVRNFSANFVFYYKTNTHYVSSTNCDTDEGGIDGEWIRRTPDAGSGG